MDRATLRSEWTARPPTLRLLVVGYVLGIAFSATRDPSQFSFPAIVFTLVLLAMAWKLWQGARAIWRLLVIVSAAGVVATTTVALDEPAVWAGTAGAAFELMLLLARPTRAWVEERSAELHLER